MPNFNTMFWEKDGPIARVILHRPEVLNAINNQATRDLQKVADQIGDYVNVFGDDNTDPNSPVGGEEVSAEVIDVRSLVPLDTTTLLQSVAKTGRMVTVEENPRLCGWGAEVSSIVAEEAVWDLDGPIVRVTTPHIPLPAAAEMEDLAIPSADQVVAAIMESA